VAVPQIHDLGAEAEVDFGEFYGWLDGEWTRLWMFVMRLSASGRAFHGVFGNQAGESFYEGHNLAFAHFGGVPGRIRYDNLRPAVIKVLLGRERGQPSAKQNNGWNPNPPLKCGAVPSLFSEWISTMVASTSRITGPSPSVADGRRHTSART